MKDHSTYQELISLADFEFQETTKLIPKDPVIRLVLFIEMTRVSDYLQIGEPNSAKEPQISIQELDIIRMGWNLAASLLFKPNDLLGFPNMESTSTTRSQAISLLFKFGCTSLLKRVAEMVRFGHLSLEKDKNTFTFMMNPSAKVQFLDEMEFSFLNNLEDKLRQIKERHYSGWNLVDNDNIDEVISQPGNFLSVKNKNRLSKLKVDNIDSTMLELIKPWDSGKGIMMGYDSTPEIDHHFLALAAELIAEWRDEAGFHPNMKIGEITGGDVLAVVTFIVSFHLKHVHFASLAPQKHPEISIPQSLTIWSLLEDLVRDISDFSGMEKRLVSQAIKAITLKPSETDFLKAHSSKFMPLVIDIGNGIVLRPVSSLVRNPLFSISTLLKVRNPHFKHNISLPREDWLRSYLYALFIGSRYQCVSGNIKIRIGKKTITDIDGAILDEITGELALFQIKWQDYFINDVKQLRSKASNLTRELEEWAEKVSNWIDDQGIDQLIKSLRLKNTKKVIASNIYLFGLSKNAARMQGFGYILEAKNIAISTWAQFIRNRTEVGPSSSVFGKIFHKLKEQESDMISSKPLPIKISVGDKILHFKDLWNAADEE